MIIGAVPGKNWVLGKDSHRDLEWWWGLLGGAS